jgi:hypothetical protein
MCNELKKCNKCGEEKSVVEFSKSSVTKDGLQSQCKDCKNQYNIQYRKENAESVKQYGKEYRKYNAQFIKQYGRKYYKDNAESIKQYGRKYRKDNAEYVKEKHKQYLKDNPEKNRCDTARHRAKKTNQLHPNHNKIIEEVLQSISTRVSNCLGIKHNVDHIWPLSQGGLHHHCNLQVITESLNNKKKYDMCMEHPGLRMWYDLPDWLIQDTVRWN